MFHAVHSNFFANASRHNDKGNVYGPLPGQVESTDRIKLGQRVVRKDYVKTGSLETRYEVRLGLDTLPDWRKPFPTELAEHQLNIIGLIFENENPERRGHSFPCRLFLPGILIEQQPVET